ncbi:MAG: adenylate/guanylate cyclase domain-containing protein [Pseudomonadota bacterium]
MSLAAPVARALYDVVVALSSDVERAAESSRSRLSWTGRFADPVLEQAFRLDDLEPLRRFLNFSVGLASLTFLAFAVHDALVVPQVRTQAWAVRFGVFVPASALVLWLLNSRHLLRFSQLMMLVYGIAASFVVLYIGAIAGGSGYFLYTSFAVAFVTLGPFVARLSVVAQLVYTLLTLLIFALLDRSFAHYPLQISLSVASALLSLGGLGALIAYRLEQQARQSFLQRRLIDRQVHALAAEKARAEELLLNVLPASIAERLKRGQRPIADGFPRVSVLFADIVGFTKMSERITPVELVDRLNRMFSSFDDLADKLKLEKIKTIGDAYMVAGGLHSHEYDHAQMIAEMALAMQRRALEFSREFGEELSIRIGIHTGPVVAGVIGKRKFIYDVWGDTVNTASRMESHGEPGAVHVTEETRQLLKDMYILTPRGEISVKGKGVMRTWFLIGPQPSDGSPAQTQLPRKIATSP